jgi:hypothetical protein
MCANSVPRILDQPFVQAFQHDTASAYTNNQVSFPAIPASKLSTVRAASISTERASQLLPFANALKISVQFRVHRYMGFPILMVGQHIDRMLHSEYLPL